MGKEILNTLQHTGEKVKIVKIFSVSYSLGAAKSEKNPKREKMIKNFEAYFLIYS
jgi:hypothetical protein